MGGDPEEEGEKYRPCWHWFGDWFPTYADNFLTTLFLWITSPHYVLINWWGVRQYRQAIRMRDGGRKRRLLNKAIGRYRKVQEKGK